MPSLKWLPITEAPSYTPGFLTDFPYAFFCRNSDSERAALKQAASKSRYLPDLADLLRKETSSSKENTWQQIQSLFCKHESFNEALGSWTSGWTEVPTMLRICQGKKKKTHKKKASSPLLFCCFLPWSDSFIANYKQSHYKISSPTSEFVTCDNHLSVTQQFTCTPILQTLNSAHNRGNN